MKKLRSGSAGSMIVAIAVFLNVIVIKTAFVVSNDWYWGLLFTVPLLWIASKEMRHEQKSAIDNDSKSLNYSNSRQRRSLRRLIRI